MKPACQAAKTGDKVFLAQVSPVQAACTLRTYPEALTGLTPPPVGY